MEEHHGLQQQLTLLHYRLHGRMLQDQQDYLVVAVVVEHIIQLLLEQRVVLVVVDQVHQQDQQLDQDMPSLDWITLVVAVVVLLPPVLNLLEDQVEEV
jgi:hypothetical protein